MADASVRKLEEAEKGRAQKDGVPRQGAGASGSQIPPNTGPPPSYDSMFGKIKSTVTRQRKSNVTLNSKVFYVILAVLIFLLLIANIVMGSVFLHQCPVNTYVPIFLILMGTLIIVWVLSFLGNTKDEDPEPLRCIRQLFVNLLPVGLLMLFISGNVIIFGLEWDATKTSPKYCHPTLYWYAFSLLLVPWTCFGMLVLGMIVQSLCNIVKGLCKK